MTVKLLARARGLQLIAVSCQLIARRKKSSWPLSSGVAPASKSFLYLLTIGEGSIDPPLPHKQRGTQIPPLKIRGGKGEL